MGSALREHARPEWEGGREGPNVATNKDDVPQTLTHDRPREGCALTIAHASVSDNTVCTVSNRSLGSDILILLLGRCVVLYDVTLERRIRELCAQAVATKDAAQLQAILTELRDALRQHTEHLKNMVGDYPFSPDIGKSVA